VTRSVGEGVCKDYGVSDDLSPDPHFYPLFPLQTGVEVNSLNFTGIACENTGSSKKMDGI